MSRNPDSSTKTRWRPAARRFFYPRPRCALPPGDGGLVALERASLRLLRGPVQGVEEPADVVRVVPDAEVALDHLGDPGGRPHIRPVPVGERPLEKQMHEALALPLRQLRRAARGGPDPERPLPAAPHGVPPAHHGAGGTAEPPRHRVQGVPLPQEGKCVPPACFQHRCRAAWSHGDRPPRWTVGTATIIALFMQKSIRMSPHRDAAHWDLDESTIWTNLWPQCTIYDNPMR
jgi:hypothetical protein